MKNFLRFLKNALRYKVRLIIAVFGVIGTNAFQFISLSAVIPLFSIIIANKQITVPETVYSLPPWITTKIDAVIAAINAIDRKDLILPLCIFIICATVLRGLFEYTMKVSMETVAQNVMRDLMTSLYDKLQQLPVQFFTKMRTGELISRVTNDVNTVQAAMTARFTDNVAQVVQLPVSLIFMLLFYPKLTLLAAIVVPLIMGPIIVIGRRLRKIARKTQEKIADITAILQETISGIRIVRAFNMEDYEVRAFNRQADKFCKLRIKAVKRDALVSPITEIVGVACLLTIALILIRPALDNPSQFGIIAAYAGAMLMSIKPFRSIGKINNIFQRSLASLSRIYDLLDKPVDIREIPDALTLPPLNDEMCFSNVSFRYEPDEPPIIKDLNLTVKAGEMIAIVGPSGAGKTTLVNLIPRFYDVSSGSITIDSIDIRNASFFSLREQIGIVTQDTFLFNDSVRNNISYGRSDVSFEDIERAARAANAHDFILELPFGYDTLVGERGVRLSGGQCQRLAIARAIFKNPRILILDEATSALDTESERLVQEAIDRLVENRTVFAIAHRLSTIQHADRLLVLANGEVVQIGSHAALITDEEGLYRKLHDMQYQDTQPAVPSGFVDYIRHKVREAKKDYMQRHSSP